jgi:hypothetical protein
MLHYVRAVEIKRPAGSRRIEIFGPKIKRRLTLFSWRTHDAWLLLEADPTVRDFCERPAYVDGEAGRVLDFWVAQGNGRAKFLVVSTEEADAKSLPPSVHGVKLQVLRRPDMIACARRIENWAQIVPYRTSFIRHADRRLQNDLFARLEKPHRLERIEAEFHPIDVSAVRAALFDLLAEGRVSAPDLDFAPLGLDTVFRRDAT